MEDLTMALQKRGDTYHYHFWVAGKRYRGSTKQNNLAAARRVESMLMAEAEQKGEIRLSKRSPLLRDFSEKFLEWVNDKSGVQQRTKDYYANGWRMLAETNIAGMRMSEITRDDARALKLPGGAANQNNALRTLRRMLSKAEEWNLLKAAPKVKLLQEKPRQRVIDEAIEAKLLPFCDQNLKDVLMIMRDTGMRNRKEVFRMRWEHVDWDKNLYFVYESKTPKGRRFVPISPRVCNALTARHEKQKKPKAGWVFPARRGKSEHLTSLHKQFAKAREQAGLPDDLVLYCARHGFGTEMYRETKNLFAVMQVMGHTAVATTMKYQHQGIEEIAKVASQRTQ
jgi:integrase